MTRSDALKQLENAITNVKAELTASTYKQLIKAYKEVKAEFMKLEDDLK